MKLKSLSLLKKADPGETQLSKLPRHMMITNYARDRAFAINGLVRRIHGESFEWYGFTLAMKNHPECVVDIGLPFNDRNIHRYTGIGPENISLYRDSLPKDMVVNGWIHSHGSLEYKKFSQTDEANHLTVLDYVGSFLRKPVSRREIFIDDLVLTTNGSMDNDDTAGGSVWIVTDTPVAEARVFEIVYGCFCYGLLVGDGGWHKEEIYYRTRGILTGTTTITKREAEILPVDSGRVFTQKDLEILAREIEERINPQEQVHQHDLLERSGSEKGLGP